MKSIQFQLCRGTRSDESQSGVQQKRFAMDLSLQIYTYGMLWEGWIEKYSKIINCLSRDLYARFISTFVILLLFFRISNNGFMPKLIQEYF